MTSYNNYIVRNWKPSDTFALYTLEKLTWAPWLRKSEKNFGIIATNFSELQWLVEDKEGSLIAAVTTNRINWDGNSDNLPSWDEIAGGSTTESNYLGSYIPNGNTISLMSMNVHPDYQGKGLAALLIDKVVDMGRLLKVNHLTASFRPNLYGEYKLKHGKTDFEQYCKMKRENGELYDPWLRSASRRGMKPIRIAKDSIVVTVSKYNFEEYKKIYNTSKWLEVSPNEWECGETGSWTVLKDKAIYKEDNLLGEIPL